MPRDNGVPCPTPAKRPFTFVETKSAEDLAIELVESLDPHRISLLEVLRALFSSTHSGVQQTVRRFYGQGGAAAVVKVWASERQQKDQAFVRAITDIVISCGVTELDRLKDVSQLRHPANAIDLNKVQDFTLEYIEQHLQASAPIMLRVITGFATANPLKDSTSTIVMICSMLLFLRSQKSNHFQMMMGLYLYSCGCPSAVVDMMSQAGASVSGSSIQNALKGMTESALSRIRQEVLLKPWFLVYDNINFASRKSDQRINNTDAFESGTTATVVMTDDFITSDSVRPSYQRLCLKDLIPDVDSVAHLQAASEKALIDVLVSSCKSYKICSRPAPALRPLIPRKTITHPLPSMDINQATLVGNVEVLKTVMEKTLRLPPEWFDNQHKIVIAGDQLTVSRVSTAMMYKVIDISSYHRIQYAIPMLQLFHLQMTFCGLILETHWGSTSQPGSLQFNKLLLKRKRVSLTDFEYHSADELLRHTFHAMVKRIWEVALGNVDLSKAAEGLDDQELQDLVSETVTELVSDLLSPFPEDELRFSRLNRNMALLLRHLFIYFELGAAIKIGDVGRVEESLKWITIMFQNGQNNNYAFELLHIHCAIRHVWTREMKDRIAATWLVNTKGKENGWIPTDMYQEHNNRLIKAVYASKGSNSSWDTLASSVSVNIETFSVIRKQFDECFNRPHNSSYHSVVSAESDIELLMSALRDANILGEDLSAGDNRLSITEDKDLYCCGLSYLAEKRIDTFRKSGSSEDEDEEKDNAAQTEDPFQ